MAFTILTFGRSGSNWLRGLLNSHPMITCDGEVLGPLDNVSERLECLQEYVGQANRGFKTMYIHLNNVVLEETIKRFKIVHLIRDNVLAQCVSYLLAKENYNWLGAEYKNQCVDLEFEYLERFASDLQTQATYFTRLFPEALSVTYESLLENTSMNMAKIQEFLDVPIKNLVSTTIRQRTLPLKESIGNYLELRKRCSGTLYERFFEPLCS